MYHGVIHQSAPIPQEKRRSSASPSPFFPLPLCDSSIFYQGVRFKASCVHKFFTSQACTALSCLVCTTYGPMVPFTLTSLTSVTVSCTTHRPVSPAAYTNFSLYAPTLLSHLVYNLWARGTLYLDEPHICYSLMYDSWACVAHSVHEFFTLHTCASQLSCIQLMGPQHPLH